MVIRLISNYGCSYSIIGIVCLCRSNHVAGLFAKLVNQLRIRWLSALVILSCSVPTYYCS